MFWLEVIATVSIALGILTALVILIDVMKHPQMMKVMNIVWPITGLYFPVIGVWLYSKMGKPRAKEHGEAGHDHHQGPFWKSIFLSTTHCGSGCVIGDLIGPPLVYMFGLTIAGTRLFADFTVEFILAYLFGVAFQYFAIVPMRNLSPGEGIKDAVKADTLSLIAFQVGMFGWMAIVHYGLFVHPPEPSTMIFWFMMQIGMVIGFATSYPANWWLVKAGIKGGM